MPDDFLFDTSGVGAIASGGGGFDLGDLGGVITSLGNTFANVWKAVHLPTALPVAGTGTQANTPAKTVTPTTAPASSILNANMLLVGAVIGGGAWALSRLGR